MTYLFKNVYLTGSFPEVGTKEWDSQGIQEYVLFLVLVGRGSTGV